MLQFKDTKASKLIEKFGALRETIFLQFKQKAKNLSCQVMLGNKKNLYQITSFHLKTHTCTSFNIVSKSFVVDKVEPGSSPTQFFGAFGG